jgi:cytochrome c oxidase subunit IV
MEGDTAAGAPPSHHGPTLVAYLVVFAILCGCTLLSFIFNGMAQQHVISHGTSVALIVLVSIFKATLVAMFFMHLKYDWFKLYFIVFPVVILTVMMVIVLLPDTVLDWHTTLTEVTPPPPTH